MKRTVLALVGIALTGTAFAQTGGLSVYDRTGKRIGDYVPVVHCGTNVEICGSAAVLSIGKTAIVLPVSAQGFVQPWFNQAIFYHTTTDCSGVRYVDALLGDPTDLLPPTALYSATGGALVVPFKPQTNIAVESIEVFADPQHADYTLRGACDQRQQRMVVYPTITVEAALIGTPPFTVH